MVSSNSPSGAPIKKMQANNSMSEAVELWIGRPKVGKTSTSAALGTVAEKYGLDINPFVFVFEKGTGGVEFTGTQMQCPVCKGTGKVGKSKCDECLGDGVVRLVLSSIAEIREWFTWFSESDYNLAIIDTGDAMFQCVADCVCADLGVPSPVQANDHGNTWYAIFDLMRELIGILAASGKGIIFLMHVYMMEKRLRGGTVTTATFNISGKTRNYLAQMANQILYFDVVPDEEGNDKHMLFAEATSGIEAGDQWGIFPPELELGGSAEEAAEAILTQWGYLEE
jgi:hypothetical protein